jgi:hypothetical protein
MKKIRGDKPIVRIIHMYMKLSQGNSLCRYLYLKQAKISSFSSNLFFYKIREQEQILPGGGVGTSKRGEWWGKGIGG